jgi:purine-binding chemotaxis protein CheW
MSEEPTARQLVVFTLASEPYALPITHVHEIIRYAEPRSVVSGDASARGVISLRGRIVPVYDVASRLGVSCAITDETKIVIVEIGSEIAGVIVDAVDEVLTVQDEQFEQAVCADHTLIDSIVKIGDALVLLLNPNVVLPALADVA